MHNTKLLIPGFLYSYSAWWRVVPAQQSTACGARTGCLYIMRLRFDPGSELHCYVKGRERKKRQDNTWDGLVFFFVFWGRFRTSMAIKGFLCFCFIVVLLVKWSINSKASMCVVIILMNLFDCILLVTSFLDWLVIILCCIYGFIWQTWTREKCMRFRIRPPSPHTTNVLHVFQCLHKTNTRVFVDQY